ncbi:MAG: hypothetical protein E6R08_01160 [Nevskiaceae bacterium]|nr:MAG: hypothetical protein E6R08_01160 [Nevskiaceae bacterium]
MSNHYYLFCEQTGECVEAVAHVGNRSGPRMQANALQAYLVYHHIKAGGAPLVLRNVDDIGGRGRSLMESLEEVSEEFDSIGDSPGYTPPVLIWTDENYRSLAARAEGLAAMLSEYEQAPSGGVWVRRTADGRII